MLSFFPLAVAVNVACSLSGHLLPSTAFVFSSPSASFFFLLPSASCLASLLPLLTGLACYRSTRPTGDPRMSIPGGENPQKISNIVSAQIPRFRELYGEILNEVAKVERVDSPPPPYSPSAPSPPTAITGSTATATQQRHQVNNLFGSLSGVEDTEQEEKIVLRQPITPEHRSELLRKLPKKLREALEESFRGRFGAATTDASSSEVPLDPLSESSLFWLRVARETPAKELSADLDQSISRIIRGPATIQSLKGLLTAGVRKSVIYAGEKVRKWWAGRKEKAKALTKEKKN